MARKEPRGFGQFQMQARTTGINSVRIYKPIQRLADQDPRGPFIRRYVSELAEVPIEFVGRV